MASPSHSVLATLQRLQRRVLFGGGAVLTLLLLAAGCVALWLRLETVHQEERDALHRGVLTMDRYIGERRRVYTTSLKTNAAFWTSQQRALVATGTPIGVRLAEQNGQAMILAPGALSYPWLAVSAPQPRLAPQMQAAYLGMVETYSAYTLATAAAQDSHTSLVSFAFEPGGQLFAIAGLQEERQLLHALGVPTREQALAALRSTAEEGWKNAGSAHELALSSGRLRVYPGRNPLTGDEALVTQMRLSINGTPIINYLTFEALTTLSERLAEAEPGAWEVLDPHGHNVLPAAAQPACCAFKVSAPLRGIDWTLVRHYRWAEVWLAQRPALLLGAAMLAVLLGALWTVLLRVDRHVLRPALEQAARVHESEALSRTLIETSPVGLCLLDQQSGQLILHNQALEHLAGGTDDGVAAVVQRLLQDAQAQSHPRPLQVSTTDEDHGPRFLRSVVAASRYQQRAIWVVAVTDVTAEEETRQRLLDARHHAEQARNDAQAADQAKAAFVAMISHEIRTPLSGVLGHLELLARLPMDAQAHAHATRARSAANVLQGLVNDTLDLSRMEAGLMQLEPVTFDPRALLQQVATLFGPQAAGKGLHLVVHAADAVAPAYSADAHRLAQIINNFVGNALKFTAEGTVTVSVDTCTGRDGAARLRFEVRDTGPGIPASLQATLFEPFVQAGAGTARQHGGSGLGLALCQRFAELMGGTVGVDSTLGSGSCFHVEIPAERADAVHADATATHAATHAATGVPSVGGHALLVDDSPITRGVTTAQLEALGWQVTTATDGHDAWERWRQGRFDLVLTDLNMPGMDGYALARTLRADGATLPIFALTASALPEDAQRAQVAGMTQLLLKPLDLDALQAALRGVAAGSRPPAALPAMSEAVQAQMREAFLRTARQDLGLLQQAVDARDTQRVLDLLHGFAGALVFLGYAQAAQRCQQAEQALRSTPDTDATTQATVAEAIDLITASVDACERGS